jgi:hypothetical protein
LRIERLKPCDALLQPLDASPLLTDREDRSFGFGRKSRSTGHAVPSECVVRTFSYPASEAQRMIFDVLRRGKEICPAAMKAVSQALVSARASGALEVSEIEALFRVLRQSASPDVAAAIESVVHGGTDRELCRVNVLDYATRHGLNEESTIAAFLHAARLGIFELSWNVLCPGCGGVLNEGATLKTIDREDMVARYAPPATSRRWTRWSR